ncbi:hypothetical protein COE93_01365 [Bacillus toyonensis]|nr:hypothetical protein CN589_23140 [Bacillus toyonensis]PFY03785.1 hypothetical protein COL45_08860 [Bacillus toyonensis]PHB85862.1 hypothetical protein COE93_01365 [Bacillus toyonensis]
MCNLLIIYYLIFEFSPHYHQDKVKLFPANNRIAFLIILILPKIKKIKTLITKLCNNNDYFL